MKKVLFFIIAMVCAALNVQASISVWPTSTNGVEGYGIYDWDNPGDIAAFLNGSYQGTVYYDNKADANWKTDLLERVKAAETVKLGGNADSPKEPIGTADLQALELLTGVKYLRLDNCFPAEGTDFSKIKIGSSALLDATMPIGLTKDQIKQANNALKATAKGLKTTSGITGTVTTTTTRHYWFEVNGQELEYIGADAAEGAMITLDNYDVEVPLKLAEGYPVITYTNTKNNSKATPVEEGDVIADGKVTPAYVQVPLTQKDNPTLSYNGTPYTLDWGFDANGKTTQEVWNWGGTPNPLPPNTQLDVTHNYYYEYTFWNGEYDGPSYTYTGTVYGNATDGYYGKVENTYPDHYKFDINSSTYKYTYTDLNGATQNYPAEGVLSSPDDDMKYTLKYTGQVGPLTMTTKVTKELTVDGSTIYVNEAGKLSDVDYMFTSAQNTNLKSAKNITVIGEVNSTDLGFLNATNFASEKLLDLSEADVTNVTPAQIAASLMNGQTMRDIALVIPTPVVNDNIITGHTVEYVYQAAGVKCFAYYSMDRKTTKTEGTTSTTTFEVNKKKMNVYGTNSVVKNLMPVVNGKVEMLTFLPNYNEDGSAMINDYLQVESGFVANTLSQFTVKALNLMWFAHSSLLYDFSGLNPATHFLTIPHNSSSYYTSNDICGCLTVEGSDYYFGPKNATGEYNIWVVTAFASPTAPYGGGISFDYDFVNAAGNNQTSGAIYIRQQGKLGAMNDYITPELRTAEKLVITGHAVAAGLNSLANYEAKYIDLSRLDLLNDATNTATILDVKNDHVEYMALPDDALPSNFKPAVLKKNNPSLKGVGLYKEATKTVGDANEINNKLYYSSWQAGSLRKVMTMLKEAQGDGESVSGIHSYKMWGPLNAADISNTDARELNAAGNYDSSISTNNNGGTQSSSADVAALLGKSTQIYKADLSMAWFPVQDDMQFQAASAYGKETFKYVELPRTHMTIIPAYSLQNNTAMTKISIPDIYTTIKTAAFDLCENLWQVDVHDIVVSGETDLDGVTFGTEGHASVYDYVSDNALIKQEYSNGYQTMTLPASLGSAEGEGLYPEAFNTRNNYITDVFVMATTAPRCAKDAFGSVMYCGNNTYAGPQAHPFGRNQYRMGTGSTDPKDENHWIAVLHFPTACTAAERANYRDVTREYSLSDETGAVDGAGKPLKWPTQTEFLRAYNQAKVGAIWDAWKTDPERDGQNELTRYGESYTTDYSSWGNTPGFNEIYAGWHQFVLAANWQHFEEIEKEAEEYDQMGWYTFCIPYDMTKDEVVKYLGVPKNNKVKRTGESSYTDTDEDILPDVYTLVAVDRNKKSSKITLKLASVFSEDGSQTKEVGLQGVTLSAVDNNKYLKGGYPYFIKPYVPTDLKDNLGLSTLGGYVLLRNTFDTSVGGHRVLIADDVFRAPYEQNVQAFEVNEKKYLANDDTEDKDGNKKDDTDFVYTFVGQYWEQNLPLNSYYLGTGDRFYRASKPAVIDGVESDIYSKWTWKPYAAIITAKTSSKTTKVTEPIKGNKGYTQSFSMLFTSNDDKFKNTSWSRSFEVVFDDEIKEFGDDENSTTAVETLNGERIANGPQKVYSMSGQYVGQTLEGLAKGVYIVNGKKVVLK